MDTEFTPQAPESAPVESAPAEHSETIENVVMDGEAAVANFPTEEQIEAKAQEAQAQAETRYAGKYASVEDLEKGYMEAQRKLTEMSQNQNVSSAQETGVEIPKQPSTFGADIDQILEQAGLDGNDTAKAWTENGQLNQEHYDAFENIGFNRKVVDTFIAGQEALVRNQVETQVNMRNTAVEMAGGEDALQGLYNWAQRHYPEHQQEALNVRLADPQKWEGAMKEMMFDYGNATGTTGSTPLTQSTEAATQNVSGFTNTTEVLQAFEEIKAKGRVDATMKAKLERTPNHLLQGINL